MYEYIAHGDVSDFLRFPQESHVIKSIILQVACIIMQLASIYKIYHGDINSGNILIDKRGVIGGALVVSSIAYPIYKHIKK